MVIRKIEVKQNAGIHLRPAQELCEQACMWNSSITMEFRNRKYNAKSLLGVLSAGVSCGDEIILTCSGEDEEQAMQAVMSVFRQ